MAYQGLGYIEGEKEKEDRTQVSTYTAQIQRQIGLNRTQFPQFTHSKPAQREPNAAQGHSAPSRQRTKEPGPWHPTVSGTSCWSSHRASGSSWVFPSGVGLTWAKVSQGGRPSLPCQDSCQDRGGLSPLPSPRSLADLREPRKYNSPIHRQVARFSQENPARIRSAQRTPLPARIARPEFLSRKKRGGGRKGCSVGAQAGYWMVGGKGP